MLNRTLNVLIYLSLTVLCIGQHYVSVYEREQFQDRLTQMHDLAHMAGRYAMLTIIDVNINKICQAGEIVYVAKNGDKFICTKVKEN
jgi:hypothetical protein